MRREWMRRGWTYSSHFFGNRSDANENVCMVTSDTACNLLEQLCLDKTLHT